MKKKGEIFGYALLFTLIVVCDRFTKQLATVYCQVPFRVNSFFSCDLTINRGISWGMLDSQNAVAFVLVTGLVLAVMGVLAWYGIQRWRQGSLIIGEVCALAGAFSNIIDRFLYKGVLDFCMFHVGNWAPFGIFNGADVAIVIGAILIFMANFKNT